MPTFCIPLSCGGRHQDEENWGGRSVHECGETGGSGLTGWEPMMTGLQHLPATYVFFPMRWERATRLPFLNQTLETHEPKELINWTQSSVRVTGIKGLWKIYEINSSGSLKVSSSSLVSFLFCSFENTQLAVCIPGTSHSENVLHADSFPKSHHYESPSGETFVRNSPQIMLKRNGVHCCWDWLRQIPAGERLQSSIASIWCSGCWPLAFPEEQQEKGRQSAQWWHQEG